MPGQHRNGGNVRVIDRTTETLPALPIAPIAIIVDEHRLAAAMIVAAIEERTVTDTDSVALRAAVIMRMREKWNGTRLRCSRCGGLYTVQPDEGPNWQVAGITFGTCWNCTVELGRALPSSGTVSGESATESNADGE
jgi:hypothetical protein